MDDRDEVLRDLTLMLLYLTSWTERSFDARRSWKGYDFDVLNLLEEQQLISGSRTAKSVYLSEEGVRQAQALLAKYGIEVEE